VDKAQTRKRPAAADAPAASAAPTPKISKPFKYVNLNTWAIKVDGKQWVSVPCPFFVGYVLLSI